MLNELEEATATIQEGTKRLLAFLPALHSKEEEVKARVASLQGQEKESSARLIAISEDIAQKEIALKQTIQTIENAASVATEKTNFIINAGREEAKRLIDAANNTCKEIVAQREAAREELATLRRDTQSTRDEWENLKTRIAEAKAHFLRATSH